MIHLSFSHLSRADLSRAESRESRDWEKVVKGSPSIKKQLDEGCIKVYERKEEDICKDFKKISN